MGLHEACIGVQVHTGTRIHWGAHQTFFCTKARGRGGSKQILREYGFKKTSKITDDPLLWNSKHVKATDGPADTSKSSTT